MENKFWKHLADLETTDRIVNIEYGFFSVTLSNGKEIQCCLEPEFDSDDWYEIGYLPKINSKDCGYTWGICGEVNEWAATEDGEWGHILDRLVAEAKIAGLEVIY